MTDPALRMSLSAEDIERLSSTANYQIVQRRTPGLTPLSSIEKWLITGAVFVVGTALYIHLDVKPFLPIQLSPKFIPSLTIASFVAMVFSGVVVLINVGSFVYAAIASLWYRWFAPQPRITCPRCGSKNKIKRYVDGSGCAKCGSTDVYCAKCGRPSPILQFTSGVGCPHCGHDRILIR